MSSPPPGPSSSNAGLLNRWPGALQVTSARLPGHQQTKLLHSGRCCHTFCNLSTRRNDHLDLARPFRCLPTSTKVTCNAFWKDHSVSTAPLKTGFRRMSVPSTVRSLWKTAPSQSVIFYLSCYLRNSTVLGPALFMTYTAGLMSFIAQHSLGSRLYADDTQVYGCWSPDGTEALTERSTTCIDDVTEWTRSNWLQLNADKTEIIYCATGSRLGCVSRFHHDRNWMQAYSTTSINSEHGNFL